MREIYIFSTNASSSRGGISTATASFITCLNLQGFKTREFVTHEPNANRLQNSVVFAIAVISFASRVLLGRICLKETPIAYLHAGPKGSLIRKLQIAFIARILGARVYTHHHSADFNDYLHSNGFFNRCLLLLSKISHKNFVLSEWWEKIYRSANINNVSVVPNCLPQNSYHIISKTSSDEKVLLSVGRLAKGKNFDLVINSFSLLPTNSKLKIAGNGPELEQLKKISASSPQQKNIHFLGWINEYEKNELYNSSNIFVLPSDYDSFGMVYIEALSRGCPVVIGPNPAVMSALSGLEGVFMANEFSVNSVQQAILKGLSSTINKQHISESCLHRYGLKTISIKLIKELELSNEEG
jgi:glycosyltransferase involved in cell wall biosynthesis